MSCNKIFFSTYFSEGYEYKNREIQIQPCLDKFPRFLPFLSVWTFSSQITRSYDKCFLILTMTCLIIIYRWHASRWKQRKLMYLRNKNWYPFAKMYLKIKNKRYVSNHKWILFFCLMILLSIVLENDVDL